MNSTPRSLILIPAALMLLALSACGNKGPLVMPQKPVPIEEQEVVPADDATEPATDATEGAETKPAESTDGSNG